MKNYCSFFLKKIDILGRKISFENENKTSFNTVFGGLLTLMLFCFSGVLFYLFGKEMWEKQIPTTFSKDTIKDVVNYNMTELPMIFTILNTLMEPLGGKEDILSIFEIWIDSYGIDGNLNHKGYQLLEYCDSSKFSEKHKSGVQAIIEGLKIFNYTPLCFPINDVSNYLTASGKLFGNMLHMRINACVDRPVKQCSKTQKFKDLGSAFMVFYTFSTDINMDNYKDPVSYSVNTRTFKLDYKFNIRQDYEVESQELISDDGWIFENIQKYESLYMKDAQYEVTSSYDQNYFMTFIKAGKIRKVRTRIYLKIQDVLAKVFSILNSAIFITQLSFSDFFDFNYNKEFSVHHLKYQIKKKTKLDFIKSKNLTGLLKMNDLAKFIEDNNKELINDEYEKEKSYDKSDNLVLDDGNSKVKTSKIPNNTLNLEINKSNLNENMVPKCRPVCRKQDEIDLELDYDKNKLLNFKSKFENPNLRTSLEKISHLNFKFEQKELANKEQELKNYIDFNDILKLTYTEYFKYFYLPMICCKIARQKNLILEFLKSEQNLDKYSIKSYINMKTEFDKNLSGFDVSYYSDTKNQEVSDTKNQEVSNKKI